MRAFATQAISWICRPPRRTAVCRLWCSRVFGNDTGVPVGARVACEACLHDPERANGKGFQSRSGTDRGGDMPKYWISIRKVQGDNFTKEQDLGATRYLRVPDNEVPAPRHTIGV